MTPTELMQQAMPSLKLPWLLAFGVNEEADRFELQATLPPIEVQAEYSATTVQSPQDAMDAWQTLILTAFAKSSDCQIRMMRQVLKALHSRPRPEPDTADHYLIQLITSYFGLTAGVNGALLWLLDQAAAKAAPAESPGSAPIRTEPEIKTDPEVSSGEATPTTPTSESSTVSTDERSVPAPEPQAAPVQDSAGF